MDPTALLVASLGSIKPDVRASGVAGPWRPPPIHIASRHWRQPSPSPRLEQDRRPLCLRLEQDRRPLCLRLEQDRRPLCLRLERLLAATPPPLRSLEASRSAPRAAAPGCTRAATSPPGPAAT